MKKPVLAAMLSLSTLVFGGCMYHGGHTHHTSQSTLGKELTDLKTSLDAGAVSESEYHVLKAELIADPHRSSGKRNQ